VSEYLKDLQITVNKPTVNLEHNKTKIVVVYHLPTGKSGKLYSRSWLLQRKYSKRRSEYFCKKEPKV
jgi:hypothetical protein